ncbi:MAG TPA: restriction endonuclease subunit S [Anaerolineae bacterium]|nr:restriction endonuclease subunit S [Anaerolineae bacterium]
MSKSRWQPYPAYKDSGVEWLGKIPLHWQAKRVKWVFNITNGSTPTSTEPGYWDGDIPWVTPNDLGKLQGDTIYSTERSITERGYQSCGTTLVAAGSLVLSTRAPIGHLAIAGMNLCTNQGCRALAFRSKDNNRFFYYQLLAVRPELESLGRGSTFLELGRDELEAFPLAYPSSTEQRAIAAFLDRETARIDALVAKQERLIALLLEKRAALISHAVTRGLDPNVPMKDSGVPWWGEIPANWEIMQIRYMAESLQTGPFGSQLHSSDYSPGSIPVINPSHMQDGHIKPDMDVAVDQATWERLARHELHAGDIVFARRGELGRCALVTQKEQGWLCGTGSLRMRPKVEMVYPPFLVRALSTRGISDWLMLESVGSTMDNLNTQILSRVSLPIPSVEEQRAIADHLDRETTRIDALIARVQEIIERLQEHRTALISAAVTGKVDVRETEAQP